MSIVDGVKSNARAMPAGVSPLLVLLVLALTFALRLLQLKSALSNPLTYQPGPDEDFYFRFGQAVARGAGSESPEFAFMDPAYAYILGFAFKLLGPNVHAIYLLQVVLDTLTAYCIYLVGRELGRPRAGLGGALVYGLTCTAVLFSTTLLKATWVANYMTLWVLFGLLLLRTRAPWAWLLFGAWCGYGIALRGNLTLMAALAMASLPWLNVFCAKRSWRETLARAALLLVGLALPLALLTARNEHVSKTLSPLPNNGGVVLHQVYNPDNPKALTWIPSFVNYSHPSEIWRGYAAEAERRAGRGLSPGEVSQYWRREAVAYIQAHPLNVMANCVRKLGEFVAYPEVPNNRSLADERLFSPVLRVLPSPFGWLFALGVPGLAMMLCRDRRALLLIAPVAVAAFTVAVFFAEDRFRFHAVPMLALGVGLFLDDLYAWLKARQALKWIAGLAVSAALGGTSVLLAHEMPQPKAAWDRIVWGYVKMGNNEAAKGAALKGAAQQPDNDRIQEALGYVAASEGQFPAAAEHYRRAAMLKPNSHVAHYNLARILIKLGRLDEARSEAQLAVRIAPLPEYQRLLDELIAQG